MNKSTNKSLKVAKYNFTFGSKETYWITGITMLLVLVNLIVQLLVDGYDADGLSLGNYFALIIVLAPIFIVAKHYRKLINIGAKKMDLFRGCVINYVVFAVVVTVINTLFHYVFDSIIYGDTNLLSFTTAFGWANKGVAAFMLYQFGFYMLLSLSIHTLVLYQNMWIGWVADVMIAAVISVFTPIAPLREYLISFFNAFVFNPSVFLQFIYSLFLGGVLYISTLYNLARK